MKSLLPCLRICFLLFFISLMPANENNFGSAETTKPGLKLSAAEIRATFTATPIGRSPRETSPGSPSSRAAITDPGLLARNDNKPVRVMIKLDYDAVASYSGGIQSLAATSPRVTGKLLKGDSAAELEYDRYISSLEERVIASIVMKVPDARIGQSIRIVYGGITATIPANSVQKILGIDGVVAVHYDHLNHLLTDSSPQFIGADDVYAALGTTANAGAGVLVAVLDTGVWPEHPSFADLGNLSPPPGPALPCNFGDNPLTPATDPFVCNNKLIGGRAFMASYNTLFGDDVFVNQVRDSNGHGTHTTSITAGNIVQNPSVLGQNFPPIHGIAPGAWVISYKVCGPQGCLDSDAAQAVQQAILDGVDVINYSIAGGIEPFADPVELAFLDAYAAGVFVAAAAGDSGSAGTVDHLSPWVTSVGASTQEREFHSTLTLNGNAGNLQLQGSTISPGISVLLPVVLASDAPYNNGSCTAVAPPGLFTGKIVACAGGFNSGVEKGFNVLSGGGAGMILFNPGLTDGPTDSHWLPTIHITDGNAFTNFMNTNTGETGSFTAFAIQNGEGDVMAAFSSRGPAGLFIKPDITAPGVQILAGDTPVTESIAGGPPGELFQAIAGTSMSSPHAAGAAILFRELHPDWSPGQIKSALVTTATTEVFKQDQVTPADPFDFGSGRVDIGAALNASLTMDETAGNFFTLGNDPLNAVHLNIPSINAPVMPGRLITTRTVTNSGVKKNTYKIITDAPADSSIEVSPSKFKLKPGESEELTITIESDAPIGAQQFGAIQITGKKNVVQYFPVAFIHAQDSVTLTQSCDETTLPKKEETNCTITATNNSISDQVLNFDILTSKHLDIVGATGATIIDKHHAQLNNVTLNAAQPGVPSVAAGALFGYIPLDVFGVTPTPIGDEEFHNFSVPPFIYNGEQWNAIGVTSNGFIVVGGATSADVICCNLPPGPSPALPNNILAPFWTDLDGTNDAGILAATLNDGVNAWIVIEFRLDVFGTNSQRVFQTWMGINGVQDIVHVYDPANLPASPGGQDFLVGAENILGQGGMSAVLPTGDLRVTSSAPVLGESTNFQITINGKKKGLGLITTEMTGNGILGVTVENTVVNVIR